MNVQSGIRLEVWAATTCQRPSLCMYTCVYSVDAADVMALVGRLHPRLAPHDRRRIVDRDRDVVRLRRGHLQGARAGVGERLVPPAHRTDRARGLELRGKDLSEQRDIGVHAGNVQPRLQRAERVFGVLRHQCLESPRARCGRVRSVTVW